MKKTNFIRILRPYERMCICSEQDELGSASGFEHLEDQQLLV